MLAELYNNPTLIISIVIFLICVIIGFIGDLYLKKVKKEEEAKNRAENTRIAKEEQIETLDTEPVVEPTEILTTETPVLQTSPDQFAIDNSYSVSDVQPINNTYNETASYNNVAFEQPINDFVQEPVINNGVSYEVPVVDFTNNVSSQEAVSYEQPVNNMDYNVAIEQPVNGFEQEPVINNSVNYEAPVIDFANSSYSQEAVSYEQPIMPTNINSDYNIDMSYEQSAPNFVGYETPVIEPVVDAGFEMPNNTFAETNITNEYSNDFVSEVPSYETPIAQEVPTNDFEKTEIFEPINNYGYEMPVSNDMMQNDNFLDNSVNNNLNNNNNIF